MLTLEQAQAAMAEQIRRVSETETVALVDGDGRRLAAEVVAQVDNPAFDNSAMDGYAVNTADLSPDNLDLPVVGESSCGDAPGILAPGTTMRIFTGAPLPAGADAVVIQEDIRRDGDRVSFPHSIQPSQNIRRRGEDFRTGKVLFARGRRLSPFDLALLSSAGVAQLPVYRRPRALVVATGNELVSPGTPLKPGQIYESNRLATLLQLRALGVDAIDGGAVRDNPDDVRAMLGKAVDYDFVITSGGVSVGDHDLIKQVFAELGTIDFWKVKIKPGKPLAFGRLGERCHFFGLPGNPVSSLVTFKLFVEPALAAWHHGEHRPLQLTATAANPVRRHAGRTEFLRGRLFYQDDRLMVTALKSQGSHMLGALRETNALIRVEADSQGYDAGASVPVLPLRMTMD